jgi:hypothetical protein
MSRPFEPETIHFVGDEMRGVDMQVVHVNLNFLPFPAILSMTKD